MSAIFLATLSLLLLAGIIAWWRGGKVERTSVGVLALAWVLRNANDWDGVSIPWGVITVDGFVFLILLYFAAFSQKTWTLFATGFAFLVLATHIAFLLNLALEQWSYITAYYLWMLALQLSLILGTLWSRPSARV